MNSRSKPDAEAQALSRPVDGASANLERLIAVMARLRDPERGCSWDVEQTWASIAPYTIEEAYEVADAIERGDTVDLRDELGDLLLQVVYHARIAEEAAAFTFADVAHAVSEKMVRRHPHIFAGAETFDWEAIKAAERASKAAERAALGPEANAASERPSAVLSDVSAALPALSRAQKLQARAARVGFDWPEIDQVVDKIAEEAREVSDELKSAAPDKDRMEDEIGDLLFVVVNLARWLGADAESALKRANRKFVRRFGHIERRLGEDGRAPDDATLDEMEALWTEAKDLERGARSK